MMSPDLKQKRAERFADHLKVAVGRDTDTPTSQSTKALASPKRLKGTCFRIEKEYLRLTSAPKPSDVRPLPVLKKSLEHVTGRYCETEDYSYLCEQLKSIRQDLTVQNINNRFSAHVYETHGRIALECGDLTEYNQCQSRLQEMKRLGIPVSEDEFNSYRLLHSLFQNNKLELVGVLRDLVISKEKDSATAVKFAIDILRAYRNGNYIRFGELYNASPHRSGYLLDYMVAKIRNSASQTMMKACTTCPLEIFSKALLFCGEESLRESELFLLSKGFILRTVPNGVIVDCKATLENLKSSKVVMTKDVGGKLQDEQGNTELRGQQIKRDKGRISNKITSSKSKTKREPKSKKKRSRDKWPADGTKHKKRKGAKELPVDGQLSAGR
jgi:hypothetical protein